ncbi:MAG: polyprenyl synthetase family protein, partial [Planctomycetia bacterium]|nr:polyprenyl synthetase family protein [Planctomycetia bacterium]
MEKSFSVNQLPTPLQEFYAIIQSDLSKVEQLLRHFLTNDNPFIQQVADHGFRLGGKRMRPALHLFFALMGGEIRPIHHVIGAVLETIHTASLVHDDILDEAKTRRHLPTVNAVWDNETSVLMGDYMVARAMLSVAELDNITVNRIVAETSCQLCDGEMRQVGSRGRFDLTEDEYYAIITGKTAALFECGCRLGVLCALED